MIFSGSLRRGLLLVSLLIATLTLLPVFAIYSTLQYQEMRNILLQRADNYAELLASNAQHQMTDDSFAWSEPSFEVISRSSFVQTLHIYRYRESNAELSFHASYNRPGSPPIAARFAEIETLSSPVIEGSSIEVIKPVYSTEGIQGYLFLRADMHELYNLMRLTAGSALLLLLLAIVLALSGSQLLSRYFTRPLNRTISTMQEVARTKNYSLRLADSDLIELDMLAHNFNTMLDRIQQYIRQREKADLYAHQLNTELEQQVQQRTEALRQANQELLDTLEQLHQHQGKQVEAQKMSSLSELVAGISHEINTPVGLAVTASSMMQDKLYDMQQAFARGEVSNTQFANFLSESNENLDIINRNVNRAADLVNNFKKLAVEHATESYVEVNLAQMLNDIIASADSSLLPKDKFPVRLDCPPDINIRTKTGVWQQVLFNLLENSALHAFHERNSGEIRIQVSCNEFMVKIVYSDSGTGVPNDILHKIFDPFITTKRGSGNSGLGMHLVYNLVTHTLGGRITCKSEPGEGFVVIMECPVEQLNLH
ncbi:HAMP domain-containing histidine kinase [Aliidiomarina minuta]|uniref:histidine kinase n=1 Tax=Aliidiomarina minuta TaxID=880057 RepID=A0A432W8N5_9GAMM|nr:HAMP domain-containing sensor histidine kinase [Aliidiomarina minuta]RUO26474.1 HAMP domain-containing histidine kinase [Aliidiomarina minuta]